ncbi:hypothetical protein HY450_01660 [Candidatus Pacearchaeota archaeon]|nr:hypothetical protein [Candidatus Pacearchaeota archaeon]
MKIAVDVDEVLASLIDAVLKYYNNLNGTCFAREDFKSYNWWDVLGREKEEVVSMYYDFWKSPYSEDINPVRGSLFGIDSLSRKNKIISVTSRQFDFITQTKRWIEQHYYNKIQEVYFTNELSNNKSGSFTKSEICLREGVDLLIDDHVRHAVDCAEHGIDVLIMNSPWNRNFEDTDKIKRVYLWEDVVSRIC